MDESGIIDRILELVLEIIESGGILDDELIRNISSIIMEALQSMQPAAAPVPETPKAPYPSSNIFGFQYDPQAQKLLVKFMGKDTANAGPVYSYDGVPKFIFDVLRRGAVGPKTSGKNKWHTWKKGKMPSHGAAMAALIKEGGFNYRKVA